MEWFEGFETVRPHVFRISTPSGSGTGYLVSRAQQEDVLGIATAAHVIDHPHYWEQPIRLEHFASGKSVLLRPSDRAIFLEEGRDTGAIVCKSEGLPVPDKTLDLAPERKWLKVGVEIAWAGFPAVSHKNLCLFSGRISAYIKEEHAYLVDGVAINGVSGGPAFRCEGDRVVLVGVVSAYIPNRATGEVLPGLALIRDVSQFQDLSNVFKSVDEAKKEEAKPEEPPPEPRGAS